MSLISLAIAVVVLIAIAAVVSWFVKSSGVVIPQPLLIVIYAAIAVIAILFLARLAGVWGVVP